MSNSFKHLSVDERNDIQAGLNLGLGRRAGGRTSLIGLGKGSRPPLPPNRTGGSPAYGSPVRRFHIGTG